LQLLTSLRASRGTLLNSTCPLMMTKTQAPKDPRSKDLPREIWQTLLLSSLTQWRKRW
jgi:hypothetical protein